jgi:CRISPR-associated protein Cas2
MRFVISYDIVDTKRRTKVANTLLNYGVRVQYSVFECRISMDQKRELQRKIEKIIHLEEDIVCIYYQCADCYQKKEHLGIKDSIVFNNDIIIK